MQAHYHNLHFTFKKVLFRCLSCRLDKHVCQPIYTLVLGQNPPGHIPPGHLPQGHLPPGHLPPGHLPPGHLPPRTHTP